MFYHVSYTLSDATVVLEPRAGRRDTRKKIDIRPCICVAPTPEQALVACGDFLLFDTLVLYECDGSPSPAHWVFDFEVTAEHRFYETIALRRVGVISISILRDRFKHFSFSTLHDCRQTLLDLKTFDLRSPVNQTRPCLIRS